MKKKKIKTAPIDGDRKRKRDCRTLWKENTVREKQYTLLSKEKITDLFFFFLLMKKQGAVL